MTPKKKLLIWTEAYSPFVMGGDPNAPIGTEIEIRGKPYNVGKGIEVYIVNNPVTKGTHIVEATTGALVGSSIVDVEKDVDEGNEETIRKQLEAAKERAKDARVITQDRFWRYFKVLADG